jgi:hypothetical protein
LEVSQERNQAHFAFLKMNIDSKVASILGISDDGIRKAHTDYAKMHLEETGAEFLLGFHNHYFF